RHDVPVAPPSPGRLRLELRATTEVGMDVLTTINRVLDRTEVIVDKVEPSQLGNSTLCTEWSVRDIINHVTGGGTMFAECAEGPAPPNATAAEKLLAFAGRKV